MITEQRLLYSGIPVWEAYRRPRILTSVMSADLSVDVLVIGAG